MEVALFISAVIIAIDGRIFALFDMAKDMGTQALLPPKTPPEVALLR
jgi:hypothetical protein